MKLALLQKRVITAQLIVVAVQYNCSQTKRKISRAFSYVSSSLPDLFRQAQLRFAVRVFGGAPARVGLQPLPGPPSVTQYPRRTAAPGLSLSGRGPGGARKWSAAQLTF